jgi:hypothetical protein
MPNLDINKLTTKIDGVINEDAPMGYKVAFNFTNIDMYLSNFNYLNGKLEDYDYSTDTSQLTGYHVSSFVPNMPSNASLSTGDSNTNTYKSSDLYIYKNALVIMCTANTGTTKIYYCFPIKQSSSTQVGALDVILDLFDSLYNADNKSMARTVSINSPDQDSATAYTNSNNDTIIVFSNPILLKNNLSKIRKDGLPEFTKDIKSGISLTSENITFKDDDQIYMECAPTGASKEEVQSYNVPINSQFTENVKAFAAMNYYVNFTIMVVFIILVYAFFPNYYSIRIFDQTVELITDSSAAGTRLDSIEFIYSFLCLLFGGAFFTIAIINNFDYINFLAAITIVLFYIMTSTIIGFSRNAGKKEAEYEYKFSKFTLTDVGQSFKGFYEILKEGLPYSPGGYKPFRRYLYIVGKCLSLFILFPGACSLIVLSLYGFNHASEEIVIYDSVLAAVIGLIVSLIWYVSTFAKELSPTGAAAPASP